MYPERYGRGKNSRSRSRVGSAHVLTATLSCAQEFELAIPRGPAGEIGAQIRMGIERKGLRGQQQRLSRVSFSLDRFVQQIHIKSNASFGISSTNSGSVNIAGEVPTNVDNERTSGAVGGSGAGGGGGSGASGGGGGAPGVVGASSSYSPVSADGPTPQLLSLTRIPEVLTSCRRLTSLTVEGQQLVSIEEVCQAEMLEELKVLSCELRDLPASLFQACPRLRMLDLSHNLLTAVPVNTVPERLQFLNLGHNSLASTLR